MLLKYIYIYKALFSHDALHIKYNYINISFSASLGSDLFVYLFFFPISFGELLGSNFSW